MHLKHLEPAASSLINLSFVGDIIIDGSAHDQRNIKVHLVKWRSMSSESRIVLPKIPSCVSRAIVVSPFWLTCMARCFHRSHDCFRQLFWLIESDAWCIRIGTCERQLDAQSARASLQSDSPARSLSQKGSQGFKILVCELRTRALSKDKIPLTGAIIPPQGRHRVWLAQDVSERIGCCILICSHDRWTQSLVRETFLCNSRRHRQQREAIPDASRGVELRCELHEIERCCGRSRVGVRVSHIVAVVLEEG